MIRTPTARYCKVELPRGLIQVFNVLPGNDGPAVSSFLKQGDGRRMEVGISERADRHRDEALESRTGVEDGGAAVGAEVEGRRCSALAPGRVLAELPRWLRVGLRKASLAGKRAATALLALEAMTYRYPNRIILTDDPELTTPASGDALDHGILLDHRLSPDQAREPRRHNHCTR